MTQTGDLLRAEGIFGKGFGIVPKLVMRDQQLSLESKAIYAYLCALAGGGEVTFPYRDTILRQLGMAKNTYYRHYSPLVEQGYLRVDRPPDKKAANLYTLVADPPGLNSTVGSAPGQEDGPPASSGRLGYKGLKSGGYGVLPRAVMQDPRLSVKAKGLYAYFCSYCGAGDCAFPRKEHILFHLGISDPTYYKALGLLKDLGYIDVVQRNEGGRFGICDYYLNEQAEPCDNQRQDSAGMGAAANVTTPNKKTERAPDSTLPYTRICDTKICDTKKWDIKNRDTKNGDAYINNSPSINSVSSNSPSSGEGEGTDPMTALALDKLAGLCPSLTKKEQEAMASRFVMRFQDKIRGRTIRRPGAYLEASLRDWIREEPLRLAMEGTASRSAGVGASYDLGELEQYIEEWNTVASSPSSRSSGSQSRCSFG